MSGRHTVRTAAQRAIGVPDATAIGATLAELETRVAELTEAVAVLGAQRADDAAELAHQREEIARLRAALVEQATDLEAVQGQLSAGPGR